MPKISGDSLVHYCLDLFPNMQIVVTTGDPSLTVKTNCYLDGAAGLIFKPIGPDAIVAMVQVCIDYFKRWEKIILNKK
ncbi:MAG: hypothetical protein A2451_08215 [Bdellovibrionales bacterium RIFOXYC2_FULL_39_8]|nr:MAG: hypothetical protein A2451_08215 [Bdellovibrionales bacterium RIFOXYC2_FULL_39_8]